MAGGRPSLYTEELAEEICTRLAHGETLINICRDDHMPTTTTVNLWAIKNDEFSAMYARAREQQAWFWAEETLHIADETQFDMTEDENGKPIMNWEHMKRSQLKIDTRKWIVTKIAARVFGDRVTQEHTGQVTVKACVDAPPQESRQEWLERKQKELEAIPVN